MTNSNPNDALFITFKNAIAQKLVARGFLPALPSDLDNNEHVQAAYTGWLEENSLETILDNVVLAITSVQEWIDNWEGYQPEPLHIEGMKVSLSMPLATGMVATFDLVVRIPQGTPPTPENISALQVRAYDLLKQSVGITAARRSAAGVPPQASATDKATGLPEVGKTDDAEAYDVEALYIRKENGKEMLKVKGGKYMEHGVNCYPEVWRPAFQKAGLSYDQLKVGENYKISGRMKVKRGDKANHVVQLWIKPTKPTAKRD